MEVKEISFSVIRFSTGSTDQNGTISCQSLSLNISRDHSVVDLFIKINKDYHFNLLPIGVTSDHQILDFSSSNNDRTIHDLFANNGSPIMLYLVEISRRNDPISNDRLFNLCSKRNRIDPSPERKISSSLIIDALQALDNYQHLQNTFFINIHHVSEKKIHCIIPLSFTVDNRISMELVRKTVKNLLKDHYDDNLKYLIDDHLIDNEEVLVEVGQSRWIVVVNPEMAHDYSVFYQTTRSYQLLIRFLICSVVFSEKNFFHLERFLNYCDTNKSYQLDPAELKVALLTIVKLFNRNYAHRGSSLIYYDLCLPSSVSSQFSYFQSILLLIETFEKYFLFQKIFSFYSSNQNQIYSDQEIKDYLYDFIQCLDMTLSKSLVLHREQTEIQIASIICENTLKFFGQIFLSPFLLVPSTIQYLCRPYLSKKRVNQKDWVKICVYLSSVAWIISIVNIIFYYHFDVQSAQANRMEIYWPFGLLVAILIILHVYQLSSFCRKILNNKNLIENTFDEAHLDILEIESTPNRTKSIQHQILERKSNEIHPTLVHQSITQSLIDSSNDFISSPSSLFHYFIYLLMIVIFAITVLLHPFIPMIYRRFDSNSTMNIWYIRSIHYSYIVISILFYTTLIALMIKSIYDYLKALYRLQKLLSSTDLKRRIDFQSEFYLNLRRKENLEYFLLLFQRILSTIDQNHLRITTMSCILLLDAVLILTAVIRVFVLGRSTDLLTIWCLTDMIILSLFLMLFVIVVVLINKSINYDFIRYLRNLKKDLFTSVFINRQPFDDDEQQSYDHLEFTIDHMDSVTDQYSVKLLGIVVDHSLALKLFISIITGIVSAVTSLIKP